MQTDGNRTVEQNSCFRELIIPRMCFSVFLFFHFLSSGSKEISAHLQLECYTATLWLLLRSIISKMLISGPLKPQCRALVLVTLSQMTSLNKVDTYRDVSMTTFFPLVLFCFIESSTCIWETFIFL